MRQSADTSFYAPVPSSAMPGIVWPAMPGERSSSIFAVLAQLEMSQWWSPEALARWQLRQATELVTYAAGSVPFYRDRLAGFQEQRSPLTMGEWRRIPLLERDDIRKAGDSLNTCRPLQGHDASYVAHTSGSTGEPISVQKNSVTQQLHAAFVLRDHFWRRRDFRGKLASVGLQGGGTMDKVKAGGTARWALHHPSGPMVFFDLTDSVDAALEWLAREDPDYLMTYPNYLRAMIERSEETGVKPSRLREASTYGEIVSDALRQQCTDSWDARLVDIYGAEELGFIALDCPEHDHYLVQSENVLVEILDDDDRPCGPGEVGRVVVTSLHNFSTPLIRYSIGDYAEVGPPCASGRGLPVIQRIHGRVRNMLTAPSGGRVWPALNHSGLDKLEPLRQFQLLQTADLAIRLRMVVDRPLTPAEETQARHAMVNALGPDFEVHLDYVDSIPRSPSGKLEDIISEVAH